MTNVNQELLRKEIDDMIESMVTRFYQEVPKSSYQKDSKHIDRNYFIRHTIETILRIKHKRMIDALVIHYFTKHNLTNAKAWAHYAEDEMLHGKLFAQDLEKLAGISLKEIDTQYQPLMATKLLNGYFYFTLEHEGPMAAIASAYFLESTTRKTQPEWLDNLEIVFGKENLKGARAHLNHDIRSSHSDFVWQVLSSLVTTQKDVELLKNHIQVIYGLFAGYFFELDQLFFGTVKSDELLKKIITPATKKAEPYHKAGVA